MQIDLFFQYLLNRNCFTRLRGKKELRKLTELLSKLYPMKPDFNKLED